MNNCITCPTKLWCCHMMAQHANPSRETCIHLTCASCPISRLSVLQSHWHRGCFGLWSRKCWPGRGWRCCWGSRDTNPSVSGRGLTGELLVESHRTQDLSPFTSFPSSSKQSCSSLSRWPNCTCKIWFGACGQNMMWCNNSYIMHDTSCESRAARFFGFMVCAFNITLRN